MDIAAWLRDLGLERYVASFEANAIDHEVLSELTEADLEKLGVLLGHRKKLRKAIAQLEATKPPTTAAIAPAATRVNEAERRQLTVMLVDLVGSTELSRRFDPEDMQALLRAYQACVARDVARFEGHVAKFMGDGVLAYFGWPRVHEDEAERAVRAGLATAEAVAETRFALGRRAGGAGRHRHRACGGGRSRGRGSGARGGRRGRDAQSRRAAAAAGRPGERGGGRAHPSAPGRRLRGRRGRHRAPKGLRRAGAGVPDPGAERGRRPLREPAWRERHSARRP